MVLVFSLHGGDDAGATIGLKCLSHSHQPRKGQNVDTERIEYG